MVAKVQVKGTDRNSLVPTENMTPPASTAPEAPTDPLSGTVFDGPSRGVRYVRV